MAQADTETTTSSELDDFDKLNEHLRTARGIVGLACAAAVGGARNVPGTDDFEHALVDAYEHLEGVEEIVARIWARRSKAGEDV